MKDTNGKDFDFTEIIANIPKIKEIRAKRVEDEIVSVKARKRNKKARIAAANPTIVRIKDIIDLKDPTTKLKYDDCMLIDASERLTDDELITKVIPMNVTTRVINIDVYNAMIPILNNWDSHSLRSYLNMYLLNSNISMYKNMSTSDLHTLITAKSKQKNINATIIDTFPIVMALVKKEFPKQYKKAHVNYINSDWQPVKVLDGNGDFKEATFMLELPISISQTEKYTKDIPLMIFKFEMTVYKLEIRLKYISCDIY